MRYVFLAAVFSVTFSSCFFFYTFKDISIQPDVKTFYVENFENTALNSPPTINQDFSEELRKKIRNETSLDYDELNPHVTFSGAITTFNVTAQAPSRDGASINRLEIKIKVEFINILHEDENWKKTFSEFADFSIDQSLSDVQEALIDEVFEQILEGVINKSFNNW